MSDTNLRLVPKLRAEAAAYGTSGGRCLSGEKEAAAEVRPRAADSAL